jgi:hypothetical protein
MPHPGEHQVIVLVNLGPPSVYLSAADDHAWYLLVSAQLLNPRLPASGLVLDAGILLTGDHDFQMAAAAPSRRLRRSGARSADRDR